jgi:CRISPR-associated protein Cas1
VTGRLWLANRNGVQTVSGASIVSDSASVYAVTSAGRRQQLMPETTSAILIGPQCTISTAAVRQIIDAGCSLYWLTTSGTKVAAITEASTSSGTALLDRQVLSVATSAARRRTARRSLTLRFGAEPPETYTTEQLRGWEGIRVRKQYTKTAMDLGIEWRGRLNEGKTDYVNALISACNSVVYTACTAGIRSLNMSSDLGFTHVGLNSFVYDIADHFKAHSSVVRVLTHFAERDRASALDSSFAFAAEAMPQIIDEVYQGLYEAVDSILERT